MDANHHKILIEIRLPIIEISRVDAREEAEIIQVINLLNSTIHNMTGEAPVGRIVIE